MGTLRVILGHIEPRLLADCVEAILAEVPDVRVVAREVRKEALADTARFLEADVAIHPLDRTALQPEILAALREQPQIIVIGVEPNGGLASIVGTNLPLRGILAMIRGARTAGE